MKELYPWQEECLAAWFENHGRGLVQAVTGSGKTILALTGALRLAEQCEKELMIKIVVPTASLMQQWQRTLQVLLTERGAAADTIGLCGGEYRCEDSRNYMIYVINSARHRLARQILSELQNDKAVLLIADECHRYGSEQNRLIFDFLPHIKEYNQNFYSLGLSATLPSGDTGAYLSSVLGREIFRYGMKHAMEMNTVCRYHLFHVGISFSPEEAMEYDDLTEQMQIAYSFLADRHLITREISKKELFEELSSLTKHPVPKNAAMAAAYIKSSYRREKLICLAKARIPCACSLIETLGSSEKIIVFGERIEQAEELYQALHHRYPGQIGRYHSKMGTQANKNTLERFRNNELRILIACKAIDEGIDVPEVSIGIVLSGTSTPRQRIQRLGRIVRKAEGKLRASLYYLYLEQSSESTIFLPEDSDAACFELTYDSTTGRLSHPEYDVRAEALLASLTASGISPEKLSEAAYVLNAGSVRGDWTAGHFDYDAKIKEATSTREQNYWICMKKLSLLG